MILIIQYRLVKKRSDTVNAPNISHTFDSVPYRANQQLRHHSSDSVAN
jgi:hypothetical protein